MSNQYRALGPWKAVYGDDVFDADYTVADEADLLARGELELVARQYRVLSDNYQVPQGEVFEGVFPGDLEAALISGGHIERVRRDAHATVDTVVDASAPEPESEPKQARRRRTANPIKE